MKNKIAVFAGLTLVLVGGFYFFLTAQKKNSLPLSGSSTASAGFSGQWKSRASIAMGGNIVCCYRSGDRMLAETMDIAAQDHFLVIAVTSSGPGAPALTSREKLFFDGISGETDPARISGKKSVARLSADGKTMTITSETPFLVVQKQAFVYVTEVWNLSQDGGSITIQSTAKSGQFAPERSWKTIFEKVL